MKPISSCSAVSFSTAPRAALARAGEGDVGLAVLDLGDVLQHHVDVDVGVGDRAEHLGGVARNVGQPDDGHLGLAAVVRDSGQDGVFHGDVLHRSVDDGAGLVGVRRADVHRHVVAAGVLHAAQHQHLGAARGHLEHLLEGDGVQPAGVGHDARVGGEDAVDVGVDLADVGLQRRGQRDRGGVRTAAAQRGDVLGVLADALESGDQHDLALVEGVADPPGGLQTEGPLLLLACPGSGKTTTMIMRIGYLIEEKNVNPKRIKAITFSRASARDMTERFTTFFPHSARVDFSTIHSLAFMIARSYLEKIGTTYELIEGSGTGRQSINKAFLLKGIYKEVLKEDCTDDELSSLSTFISSIKNRMIPLEQWEELKGPVDKAGRIAQEI